MRFSVFVALALIRGARACASTLLAALVALTAFNATAAVREYYFERAGGDHGLAQNTVTTLAQDADGFIWVGTQGGLHRFDGQQYLLYRQDVRDPGSLPDSFITALAPDANGGLWIGTYSHDVARLDLASGQITRYGDRQAGSDRIRQVMALLPTPQGIWIASQGGLDRLDPTSGRRMHILTLPAGTPPGESQALLRDQQGTIWYATAAGLYRLDRDGTVPALRIDNAGPLHSLLRDRSGRIWAGGSGGLFLLSDRRSLLRAWPHGDDAGGDVRALAQAPDDHVWMSITGAGLRRFDPGSGTTQSLRQDVALPASLPEDAINALLVDSGGLLWVGGQLRGVSVADSRGARFPYLVDLEQGNNPGTDNLHGGARADSVRAIISTHDQRLWLASDDGRLLRYAADSGFEDFSSLLKPPAGHKGPWRVMAFADPGDGMPWVATTTGLFRLDPQVPSLRATAIPGIEAPFLRSIAIGHDGSLWLGTNDAGVIHFTPGNSPSAPGTAQRIGYLDGDPRGLSNPTVHALLVDRRGDVWIGTSNGLDILNPASGHLRHLQQHEDGAGLSGNLIRALWQSANGAIWVGSHGGLNRIDPAVDGGFRISQPLAAALAGQPLPLVYSLVADGVGDLWMGTDRGLFRFNPRDDSLRHYGLSDGLQDLEFNGGAVAVLNDGRLAFGGVSGLNVFDPARTRERAWQAPLRLLSARAGGDADEQAGLMHPGTRMKFPGEVKFPESAGLLRLRIGALEYLGNERIRYRYRIDGLSHDWIDNGNRGDITYTLIPAGHYLFRAQSTNQDGLWNPQELRIPLVVTPPWWRQPIALAVDALLLTLLSLALWWRWQQRRRREHSYFDRIRDREERLKLALWASGDQFWDYDLVSDELQRMRVDDDVRGAADIDVAIEVETHHQIHRDDLPNVRDEMRRHLRGESPLFLSEHRIPGDDGQWAWVRARGRVVERDADGRALRMAGTVRDITHSRHAERERSIAAEVLSSMNEAVSVLDRKFDFVSINPAFSRMTGYSDLEIIGRNARILDSNQHEQAFYRDTREQLQHHGRWSGEMWQQRKDGEEFLCAYECSAVLDSSGQHALYVMVLTDITDQKRAEQELRYLANFDTLTNLPNRTLLSERLSRAIVRARRQGHLIAVLFLDLDRFKDINDSLGHAAGDRILRAAAMRLQETVGSAQTVARLGGDEFTVVLEHLDGPEQADKIAREIITAFEAPLLLDDRQEVSISTSIGISLYPDHAQVPTELLKHADTAMYQAKAAGRRTYLRYAESMDTTIRHRATLSSALRKVLDRAELRLVYQPRLALEKTRIVGVEALLRWTSAEFGEILPTQFIPLAEEGGLIMEIGEWVLREACLTLRRWHEQGLDHLAMSVNVSALQLLRGDFTQVVERVLAETGLPPGSLELELTESMVMANAAQAADKLLALRALGVSLAIDDFGTGYSSLSYLKRLPITTLKIDKEFVDDLRLGSDDAAITTTIIAMARSLGLCVVAEGVETQAQMEFLRAHQCDEIQGFWLSSPLEPDECLAFIRDWTPSPATLAAPAASMDSSVIDAGHAVDDA